MRKSIESDPIGFIGLKRSGFRPQVVLLAKDTFLIKPWMFVAAIFIIQTLAEFIDVSSLLALPGMLISLIIEAIFLYRSIKYLIHRYYKSAASMLLSILLLMFIAGIPFKYGGYSLKLARYVKVTLNESQYLKDVKETKPDANGYRFKQFIWGGFMANPVVLVYDDSDELMLPQEQRSELWRQGRKNSEFAHCRYKVQKIKSHFYVVDFGC